MEFPLSLDQVRRLPRHPDWKYELIAGVALLSPRPRPLGFVRPTDRSAPFSGGPALARPVDAAERPGLDALLHAVWADEDPYRSFDPAIRMEELQRQIDQSISWPGMVVTDGGHVRACAFVQPTSPPTLTWLTVAPEARGCGLASAVLAAICSDLSDNGEPLLASHASAANIPSLRWHLTRGFELCRDPLRSFRSGIGSRSAPR
jgi:GNAT superfamily N-acetyltransferase